MSSKNIGVYAVHFQLEPCGIVCRFIEILGQMYEIYNNQPCNLYLYQFYMVQPMREGSSSRETHDRAMNVSVETDDLSSAGEGL